MKNEKIFRMVFLAIAFILYSAFVFSGLFAVQSSFLASYLFSIFAFVYVLSMWIMERDNTGSLEGKKVKITPKALGILYLIFAVLQSVLSGLCKDFPLVALVVINLVAISLVIGVTVAIFQKKDDEKKEAEQAKEAIPAGDGKLLQQLRSEINILADGQENLEVKRRLQRIAERLRIAKPIRTEEIDSIDREMQAKIAEYPEAGEIGALISSLDTLLDERKRLEQKY